MSIFRFEYRILDSKKFNELRVGSKVLETSLSGYTFFLSKCTIISDIKVKPKTL